MILLYIAVGGAVGAVARYGLGGWIQQRSGFAFPWGTFAVNVIGSLFLGFAMRYFGAARVTPEMRAMITIGVLGAFTTFSTFSYETFALLEEGAWSRAGLYALGSLVVGLAAVMVGVGAAGLVLQARA